MTNASEITYKPCPFCDSKSYEISQNNTIFKGAVYDGCEGIGGWKYRCEGCGIQTCWWHTKEEMIEAWNTRHKHVKEIGVSCTY